MPATSFKRWSHRQNSTFVSPSVLIDKQDVSNALNNLSNQVIHAQTSPGNQVSQVQAILNQVFQVQAACREPRLEHEIKHRLCNLAILAKLHPKHRLATPKRQLEILTDRIQPDLNSIRIRSDGSFG
ncbi:MAG: hypothetical protein J3R72DRAFT_497457 [Linnemannia gamsii]|nr:MAG: hypothetical protein J3R72DRAFT_497457 [Linnemannia gamsii]